MFMVQSQDAMELFQHCIYVEDFLLFYVKFIFDWQYNGLAFMDIFEYSTTVQFDNCLLTYT